MPRDLRLLLSLKGSSDVLAMLMQTVAMFAVLFCMQLGLGDKLHQLLREGSPRRPPRSACHGMLKAMRAMFGGDVAHLQNMRVVLQCASWQEPSPGGGAPKNPQLRAWISILPRASPSL